MAWYYMQDQERIGPVDDAQFANLIAQGVIASQTWVWRAGMKDWKAYSDVAAEITAPQTGTDTTSPSQTVSASSSIFEETLDSNESAVKGSAMSRSSDGVYDQGKVVQGLSLNEDQETATAACVHCGKFAFTDEMIRYGASWVCADCKPAFFQKLKEGAIMPDELRVAGFWLRFCALFIDNILLQVVSGSINISLGVPIWGMDPDNPPNFALMAVGMILGFAITITYETWMVGKFGATLGKMALGLRVVQPDGTPITYLRSFARYWAKILSQIACYIGFIMVAFDDEKRGLHDRICETRVIRTR